MATKNKTTKKKPVKKKINQPSQGNCFTIMPFGGWLDDYYENIYCPAIKSAGLTPQRADDLYRPSTIVNDIWDYTKKAKIILADLSGKNANVLYELGLAHAIAKPVILITESLDDIPFDLRSLRVIEYDKNAPDWGNILNNNIKESIKEILASPLKSVLPAFLEVKDKDKTKPISAHDKELLEIRQELELLRRELRGRKERIKIVRKKNINTVLIQSLIKELLNSDLSEDNVRMKLINDGFDEEVVIDCFRKMRPI